MADLKALADAVINGDQNTALEITKAALEEGSAAKDVLDNGLIAGMDTVGARFKKNEIYIPEVLIAARAMKMAMEVLEPELIKAGVEPVGTLLIGTVQGDLHDIGKNLVAMMLKGAGFQVIDLGVDVGPEKFVEQVKAANAQLIGMSALLTTTMPGMEKTIKAINDEGTTVLLVEQNATMAFSVADRGYVLQTGEIVLHDTAEALKQNEMVQKAYLGVE